MRSAGSLLGLVALLSPAAARAEPHFAIREGLACSACHVNRSGGGGRNAFGAIYAETRLAMSAFGGNFVDPNLNESIRIGADLRFQSATALWARTLFPDGHSVRIDSSNTFKIPEGNLYLELQLARELLSVYLDETVSPESASSREAFLLLHELPLGLYLKAGRFLLPFGLRLPDDTIFVREVTGFNYGNQDLGLEVGSELGPAFLTIAATNGTLGGADDNLDKQLTGTAGLVTEHARLGLSYSYNDGSSATLSSTRRVIGAYAAHAFGRLSALVEADLVRDRQGAKADPAGKVTLTKALVFYAQADLWIVRGLNLRFGFDYHDPDLSNPNDSRNRFTLLVEAIPLPFLKVSAGYYWRHDIPQATAGNQDLILVQLHGFL